MSSIPYSRYIFGSVPWYSFLIAAGAAFAVFLAVRQERRCGLPKDTVIDLSLWIIPCGIIGARIYYVVFSWAQFRNDFWSVFRIWEGGLAIYGGLIAGLLVLLVFSRVRRLPALQLCDMIVPGVALAQAVGRWGNYFNIEAYGLAVTDPSLCFFPFAVRVPGDGGSWHLATFFYESVWDLFVFTFLTVCRRRKLRRRGDVFFFYIFLYAAGRLVIEELRTDSLYAGSSVRISQLVSVILCISLLIRYVLQVRQSVRLSAASLFFLLFCIPAAVLALAYTAVGWLPFDPSAGSVTLFLASCSVLMIVSLLVLYFPAAVQEVAHADDTP